MRVNIMKFKDLTSEDLMKKIRILKKDITCYPMWGTIFLSITPNQNKVIPLEGEYKPNKNFAGTLSEYHHNQRNNRNFVQIAEQKLRRNNFYGEYYDNNEASLKAHLNLNNIGELDEKVVLGLIKLLIDEAESDTNGVKFHFKIIQPSAQANNRFKNTDQITIYFDKYSSLGDIVCLSQKIESYLSNRIPKNTIELGPKDSFGFNSFVSARFDTNKLLAEYCEYPFFDLELQKFFGRYTINELSHLPIGALEAVFNKIITSDQIINLGNRENKALNEQDSQFVQQQFDTMVNNTMYYLLSADTNNSVKIEQKKEIEQINLMKQKIYNLALDFSSCKSEVEIHDQLEEKKLELSHYAQSLVDLQETSGKVDSKIYNTIQEVITQKMLQLQKAAQNSIKNLGKANYLDEDGEPQPLNPQAVKDFEYLLRRIKDKADKLTDPSPLGVEKKQSLSSLYLELDNEFRQYKSGATNFDNFKINCTIAIMNVRPTLEKHRDGGWKEFFVNLLKTIASLGTIPLYNYYNSQRTCFFSPVKTDSINKVEQIESAINDFQEEADQLPKCGF